MCDELEEEGKNKEERKGKGKNGELGLDEGVYIEASLVPVGYTNRD